MFLSTVTANTTTPLSTQNLQNAAIVEAASYVILSGEKTAPTTNENLEAYVRAYFSETPILAEVAYCESRFKQFSKGGEVMRGAIVPDDVGVMQINEFFHKDAAEKMGLDIHTVEGNLAYASWLYKRYGTQPWSASKPCWNKRQNRFL